MKLLGHWFIYFLYIFFTSTICRYLLTSGKAALCRTKRNRSRKSLARTHGFPKRMRTTSGRAVLKRLRANGRSIQVIQDPKNYGNLKCVDGIRDALLGKQMVSLETISLSMKKTLEEFHGVVLSLQKMVQDGRELVKGLPSQSRSKQLQQRVGIKPTFSDCLDGLKLLHEMHISEYHLKMSLVSALSTVTLKPSVSSGSDLAALQQVLVDQPNIARDEVQHIFDVIFAEEIC